jgi:hypothetical protein
MLLTVEDPRKGKIHEYNYILGSVDTGSLFGVSIDKYHDAQRDRYDY